MIACVDCKFWVHFEHVDEWSKMPCYRLSDFVVGPLDLEFNMNYDGEVTILTNTYFSCYLGEKVSDAVKE